MMNKVNHMKKLILAAFILPTLAQAEPIATPFPGSHKGINIMPLEKLSMPMKQATIRGLRSLAASGYLDTKSSDQSVNDLFNIPKIAFNETKQYDNDPNPLDTHLRSDITKLRLGFTFAGIPNIPKSDVLGFAPAGGYTHEKGWDGMVEFVQIPELGICSFATIKIESVIMYKEALSYSVNKKPSEKNILGNWETGFLYRVNWYTDTRRNSLQCANKNLKPQNMAKVITLANQIDKALT